MFRTIISPKHVEPFNEKIKIIHKNLCISLVYIHIAKTSVRNLLQKEEETVFVQETDGQLKQ